MNQAGGYITDAIKMAVKDSGLPEDKIEEITSQMATYLNTGSKYGPTPEGFLRWYIQDQGGSL